MRSFLCLGGNKIKFYLGHGFNTDARGNVYTYRNFFFIPFQIYYSTIGSNFVDPNLLSRQDFILNEELEK